MTSTHDTEAHAEKLHALLESPNPRAAFRASDLAGCNDCTLHLDELINLRKSLDLIGDEERGGLADANRTSGSSPAGHVREALREVEPSLGRSQRNWRPLWILAATAALLLLFLQPNRSGTETQPNLGPSLGEQDSGNLISPSADGDSWEEFRWMPHPAPGATYVVIVYSDPAQEHEVARSANIGAACVWRPEPDAIPTDEFTSIYWTVEVSPDMAGSPEVYWSLGPVRR